MRKMYIFPQNFIVYYSHSGFKVQSFLVLISVGELVTDKYF